MCIRDSLRFARVRIAGCDITGAAVSDYIRNLNTGSFLKVLYDVQNAVALSGSQIVNVQAGIVFDFLQRLHMAFCQIHHMDIIPYTGSDRKSVV